MTTAEKKRTTFISYRRSALSRNAAVFLRLHSHVVALQRAVEKFDQLANTSSSSLFKLVQIQAVRTFLRRIHETVICTAYVTTV